MSEKYIDIDKPQYLRGVDPSIHTEITDVQNKWRFQKMEEMGLNPSNPRHVEKFWKTVDLDEVEAFERNIDKTYSKYWIKHNEKVSFLSTRANYYKKLIRDLKSKCDSNRWLSAFKLGRGGRLAKLLPKLATGLSVLSLLEQNLEAASNIRRHPPEALDAWDELESVYEKTFVDFEANGYVSRDQAFRVKDAFIKYMRALKLNDDTINMIDKNFTECIAGSGS